MKIQNDIILKDFTGREYALVSGKTVIKILNNDQYENNEDLKNYDYVWVSMSNNGVIEELRRQGRKPIAINIPPSAEVFGIFGGVGEGWEYSVEDQSTIKKLKIKDIPTHLMKPEADFLEKSMSYDGYCVITLCSDGTWLDLSKKTPEIKQWINNTEILKNIKGVYLLCLEKGKDDFPKHSDTQNESFGTSEGQLLRIHIPLITKESIETTCWNLNLEPISHHMSVGNAYYFDTRKPHVISNKSDINRVHLALDVEITEKLKRFLMDSPEIDI